MLNEENDLNQPIGSYANSDLETAVLQNFTSEQLIARIRELNTQKKEVEDKLLAKNLELIPLQSFKKDNEQKVNNYSSLELENASLRVETKKKDGVIEGKDIHLGQNARTIENQNKRIKDLQNQIQQLTGERSLQTNQSITYFQTEEQTGSGFSQHSNPIRIQEPITDNTQNQGQRTTQSLNNNNSPNRTHVIFLVIGVVIGFAGLGLGQIIFGHGEKKELQELREKLRKTKHELLLAEENQEEKEVVER